MSSRHDPMHIINRMNAPTPFCYEPFKTQWRMKQEDGTEACYIQMSEDQSKPQWVRFGLLLESYFFPRLEEHTFVNDLMKQFYTNVSL